MSDTTSAAIAHDSDRRYAFVLVGMFALGWAVLSAGLGLINPLLPFIREEFHLSGTEAGLLTTVLTIPYLLMQIPAGVLADRLGAKRVLVVMTLVGGAGLAAMGLWAYALPTLLVFGLIFRLGTGVYYPTAFGVTARTVPASARGAAGSFLVMGMAVGSALGLAVAVPLAELDGGNWRFPMLVFGLLTLLLPAVFQLLMRPARHAGAVASRTMSAVLRDRSLLVLFAINFCTNYTYHAVMVWAPSFLAGERGVSPVLAGLYLALVNLVGFPAGMAVGVLSDRFGRRPLTMLLFPAAGASLVMLSTVREPSLMLAAIIAFGVTAKWSSDGAIAAWMGDHVAAKFSATANAVYGVSNTARMLGGLLSPLISGALLDRTGTLETGFFVGAAVLGVVALIAPFCAEVRSAKERA